MQSTDTDPDKCRRVGVEEQYIKFRPSPNFKNMKFKFQKSKKEYDDCPSDTSPSTSEEPPEHEPVKQNFLENYQSTPENSKASAEDTTTTVDNQKPTIENSKAPVDNYRAVIDNNKTRQENKKPTVENKAFAVKNITATVENNIPPASKNKSAVQPPLPLEEPPPETLEIKIKEEIVDTEYDMPNQESLFKAAEKTNPKPTPTIAPAEQTGDTVKKPKPTICRDFMRGECVRPGSCRYAHVYDESLRFKMYTFCKDYQNKGCNYPNCKFVHADPFEEGTYFRTGYLPPHARAHIKKAGPPPPPPPPGKKQALPAPPLPADFSQPPPPIPITPISVRQDIEARPIAPDVTVPLKADWTKDGAPPREVTATLVKKCEECENKEFRLQHNKEKVNKMLRASQELKEKISIIDKKTQRLQSVLINILKPMHSSTTNDVPSGLTSILKTGFDNDKNLWDHFSALTNLHSRTPIAGDEIIESGVGSGLNLPALLSILQRGTARPGGDSI